MPLKMIVLTVFLCRIIKKSNTCSLKQNILVAGSVDFFNFIGAARI